VISIVYSVCVFVTFVIQRAMRMAVLYCHLCHVRLYYFSTLSDKRHDFRKEIIERKLCVLSFSTNSV
jgi:hypothetical protein